MIHEHIFLGYSHIIAQQLRKGKHQLFELRDEKIVIMCINGKVTYE
jgi:hypothetical protein